MFKYKILVLLLLYCFMNTFSPSDCLYENLKKTRKDCCIVQVTCKTVAFRFFLTHSEVRVPWFSLRSRVSYTHRTIADGKKKSPTAISPRCPDNRRELRVHATTVYICMYVLSSHIVEYKSIERLPILFT